MMFPVFSWKSFRLPFKFTKVFVANFLEDNVRRNSSSGGAFYALSRYVLRQHGFVIGAAYQGTDVHHIVIADMSDIEKLQKSKYTPSSLSGLNLDTVLLAGKPVLFSGTPCQVKSMHKRYKDEENLILVEIACHGIPRRKEYEDYISANDIVRIDFRCKRDGWKNYLIEYETSDGKLHYEAPQENKYYQKFLSGEIIRKGCYTCKSKFFSSGADFTLADAWGVNDFASELDDNKGSSVIILHSHKAERIWEKVKGDFKWRQISLMKAIRFNPCIIRPLKSDRVMIEYVDIFCCMMESWTNRIVRLFHF